MHLNDEEKIIGQRNFETVLTHELVQPKIDKNRRGVTRRDFLVGSTAAAGVATLSAGAAYFGYTKVNNPVRIGIIGTGDEGNVLIGALNPNYVQVVAISDIRPFNIFRAFHGDQSSENAKKFRPGLLKVYGWKSEDAARQQVKVYNEDYRDLLKDANVEGVIIALPLFLHAKATVEAMQAGKHVLTEKLMGHNVAECKEMGRMSYQLGKLLATGHQRHYGVLYENAVDLIRMGLIGDIHHIRAQWHRGNLPAPLGNDSWAPPLPDKIVEDIRKRDAEIADIQKELDSLAAKDSKPQKPKSVLNVLTKALVDRQKALAKASDWAKKQAGDAGVKAENYGYQEMTLPDGKKRSALEELIRWRLWNRTGGGLMAELGSHQLDASGIFISAMRQDKKKVLPLTVTAVGGRHIFPADRDCEDHVYSIFEYPGLEYYKDFDKREIGDANKKVVVTYSSINGNAFGGYGEVVMGTAGTLILQEEQETMLFKGGAKSDVSVSKGKDGGPVIDTTGTAPAQQAAAAQKGDVSKGYREEIEHFAWAIRNFDEKEFKEKKSDYDKNVRCHPKVAMADAIIALTTNIAMRTEKKVTFKPEWFDIDHDATPEAELLPDGKKPDVNKYKQGQA
jgi:predicted dehydrogenase